MMAWLSLANSVVYYISLPIITFFSWLLAPFVPVLYLSRYILAGCLLPFTLLAKLETVYIFLGVAAVTGLVAGTALHLTSTAVGSLLHPEHQPIAQGRTAASVRTARERSKIPPVGNKTGGKDENIVWKDEISLENYGQWLEKNTSQMGRGVAGQTILEEEDDSEVGF